MPGEFEIISRYFQRAGKPAGGDPSLPVGIGDDGAVIRPSPGCELVVVADTLVGGRHFPEDSNPDDIGWRSLAVNLSDCAAMAAVPRWAFLNLVLPDADEHWLEGFSRGLFELAEREDVQLAGGDTTRGPLCITVTVLAEVPAGSATCRGGAQGGDAVFVTGWPGRARAALEHWRRGEAVPAPLQEPWQRPQPRTAAIACLRQFATAAIDVSDGLVADLGHILTASGLGATLDADALPVHEALDESAGEEAIDYLLHGGDDYELVFTSAPENETGLRECLAATGIPVTRIGCIETRPGLRLVTSDDECWELPLRGFDHFDDDGAGD